MSFHHENVCWETKAGTWRCGFFERISHMPWNSDEMDDYDPEWDDDFGSEFEWVSREFDDADKALSSAPYPNPGSTSICSRAGIGPDTCDAYDRLALRCRRVG